MVETTTRSLCAQRWHALAVARAVRVCVCRSLEAQAHLLRGVSLLRCHCVYRIMNPRHTQRAKGVHILRSGHHSVKHGACPRAGAPGAWMMKLPRCAEPLPHGTRNDRLPCCTRREYDRHAESWTHSAHGTKATPLIPPKLAGQGNQGRTQRAWKHLVVCPHFHALSPKSRESTHEV